VCLETILAKPHRITRKQTRPGGCCETILAKPHRITSAQDRQQVPRLNNRSRGDPGEAAQDHARTWLGGSGRRRSGRQRVTRIRIHDASVIDLQRAPPAPSNRVISPGRAGTQPERRHRATGLRGRSLHRATGLAAQVAPGQWYRAPGLRERTVVSSGHALGCALGRHAARCVTQWEAPRCAKSIQGAVTGWNRLD
jgi:hypothetical protein